MTTYRPYLLEFLPLIPHGRVASYKLLSHLFGIHPRKVASILMKNTDIDPYPCFKVVHSDGKIGGYNLWTDEKIRRLEGEDIVVQKGRIDQSFFWEPRISQVFVGFPIADRNLFREVIDTVHPAMDDREYIRFQSERTPHVTIRFLGNLSKEEYTDVLKRLRTFNLFTYSGGKMVYCNIFGNFHRRIFYFAPSPDDVGYFRWVSERFSSSLGLPSEDREYTPHATIFRSEFPLGEEVLSRVEKRLAGFLLPVSTQELILYATVDTHKQTPLIEFWEPTEPFYRILPHVSELRIEVSGATVEELFAHAGKALGTILFGNTSPPDDGGKKKGGMIRMDSREKETLLVDFLNELLSMSQIKKRVYLPETVRVRRGGKGFSLEARIASIPLGRFAEDIKAVTYQDVNLEKKGTVWKTKIVFDI